MILEFAISPFNMRKTSKMSIVGHSKSLPSFPESLTGFRKAYSTLSTIFLMFKGEIANSKDMVTGES